MEVEMLGVVERDEDGTAAKHIAYCLVTVWQAEHTINPDKDYQAKK